MSLPVLQSFPSEGQERFIDTPGVHYALLLSAARPDRDVSHIYSWCQCGARESHPRVLRETCPHHRSTMVVASRSICMCTTTICTTGGTWSTSGSVQVQCQAGPESEEDAVLAGINDAHILRHDECHISQCSCSHCTASASDGVWNEV